MIAIARLVAITSLCTFSVACSTSSVQTACERAERVLQIAAPFLSAAPASVQAAATALGAGSHTCGSAEYAAVRQAALETIIAFLRQKSVKAD